MTRRVFLAALATLGPALRTTRAHAQGRARLPFGSRRRAFGMTLTLSEPSYDSFDDGSFDAWVTLEAGVGGRTERVVLSLRDRLPRDISLLGRTLRVVAIDTGVVLEG